jgi:hypothetical protein
MKMPKFKSIEEEAEFWDNTDTSEILKNGEHIEIEWDIPGKCQICHESKLRRRFIDVDLYEGEITLHQIEVYYCPSCEEIIIPKSTKVKIERLKENLQNLRIEDITANVKV